MKTKAFLNRFSILILTVPLLFSLGCKDAPKQYKNANYQEPDWSRTSIPGDIPSVTFEKEELSEDKSAKPKLANDELSDIWSKAEIVYGVGLRASHNGEVFGELNFQSTFDNVIDLLPKRNWGPIASGDSKGLTDYPASFRIIWRTEEPITPELIILLNQFQGELKIPQFGKIKMRRSLNAPENGFKVKCDGDGKEFFRILFNALHDKPESFNCYDTKFCSTEILQDGNIAFRTSKLWLWVTKEDKVPYVIFILNEIPQGKLDTYFDVTKGSFIIDKGNSSENISLGETNESVNKKLGLRPEKNDVGINTISNEFSGIYLGYEKITFDRSTKEPLLESNLKTIALWRAFAQPLMINGNFVQIVLGNPDENSKLSLRLRDDFVESEDVKYLGIKNEIPQNDQKDFVNQLADLLKDNLVGTAIVQHTGQNKQNIKPTTYTSMIVGLNEGNNNGKYIQFSFDTQYGNLNSIQTGMLSDPIDKVIVPTLVEPIDITQKSLGGFTLGQKLLLEDIDIGRDEATLVYARGSDATQSIKTRVSFKEATLIKNLDIGVEESIPVRLIEVGTLTVKLGVTILKKEESSEGKLTSAEAEIVSIATDNNVQGVEELCGLSSFSAKTGASYKVIKAELDKAIVNKKATLKSDLDAALAAKAIRDNLEPRSNSSRTMNEILRNTMLKHAIPKIIMKAYLEGLDVEVKKKRAKYENFSCKYILVKSKSDSLEIAGVVFPKEGLKLSFADNELGLIQIYSVPDKEVQ